MHERLPYVQEYLAAIRENVKIYDYETFLRSLSKNDFTVPAAIQTIGKGPEPRRQKTLALSGALTAAWVDWKLSHFLHLPYRGDIQDIDCAAAAKEQIEQVDAHLKSMPGKLSEHRIVSEYGGLLSTYDTPTTQSEYKFWASLEVIKQFPLPCEVQLKTPLNLPPVVFTFDFLGKAYPTSWRAHAIGASAMYFLTNSLTDRLGIFPLPRR